MKKAWIIILATMLLLAACQPTPEEDVVINRGDTDVDAIIAASAPSTSEASPSAQPTSEPTQSPTPTSEAPESPDPALVQVAEGENPVFPARYEDRIENDYTYVLIDADVITNGLTSYPVYEVKRKEIEAEQVRLVASEIITDIVGYREGSARAKSDIEELMKKAEAGGCEQEIGWLTDYYKAAEDFKYTETDELQIPDDWNSQTYLRSDGYTSTIVSFANYSAYNDSLVVDRIRDSMVLDRYELNLFYWNEEENRPFCTIEPELSQQEAEEILVEFLQRTKLDGYVPTSATPRICMCQMTREVISMGWHFKIVRAFEYYPREVGMVDGTNGGVFTRGAEIVPRTAPWSAEYMEAYVDKDGVACFAWHSAIEVVGKVNENVKLTDFDTVAKNATELFSNAIELTKEKANERGDYETGDYVEIKEIILTLSLQKAKDKRDTAYLLPTWVFMVDDCTDPEWGGLVYHQTYGFSAIDGSWVSLNFWGPYY
ncbi:MAG: DUF6034 family protein [Clostridia bacterium]|nr:DUF6034 family protein [Clostridia bacterium]